MNDMHQTGPESGTIGKAYTLLDGHLNLLEDLTRGTVILNNGYLSFNPAGVGLQTL